MCRSVFCSKCKGTNRYALSVRKGVSTHFARLTRQYCPSTPARHSEAKLKKLKDKYKYCSTYLLFPAIFERTVEPEKFCLSVRKERPNINRRLPV